MNKRTAIIGSAIFLTVPATLTVLIPWFLTNWKSGEVPGWWWIVRILGGILVFAGAAGMVNSFIRFAVEGFGTPAPIAPPTHLVASGLYRYVRNPMYISGIAIILGQALILGRWELFVLAAIIWIFPASYVKWREEPVLSKRFGAEYDKYRKAVPAWIPRLRPWKPE